MAKKVSKDKQPDQTPENVAVEARVKQMMEPDPKPESSKTSDIGASGSTEPGTAPEIAGLPVPKEPLKIKILKDDEKIEAKPEDQSNVESTPTPEPAGEADLPQAEEKDTVDDVVEPMREEESSKTLSNEPEDVQTNEAVEDIVRKEGDDLLKAEDETLLAAFKPEQKKTRGQKLKSAIADLWKNPKKRKVMLGLLAVVVLLVAAVPTSRYFVLNTVGVRASAKVRVIDEGTLQPLRNVEVTIHGQSARTNEDGEVNVQKIKLGRTKLVIERRAFAVISRNLTIGWGSNPLGEEKLRPTGTQYVFKVTDYLSDKGVVKAEATSDDASAFSNEEGNIVLTMEDPSDEIDIQITSEGHRTENFKLNADIKTETSVKMVPARKHAYISRRDGRFDVYAKYADGKEESLILKGTGNERDDMVLVPHPTEDLIALVSTRDGERNDDGFLLSDLNIIDLRTKSIEHVEVSERIQLTGWFGERLVYVRVVSGASASNPKRNRLMAYHYKDDTNNELASSNYFNDVMAVGDLVYYAPTGAYAKGVNVNLFSIRPDGTDRKILLDEEVWNMFRTKYDNIAISSPGKWRNYHIGDAAPTELKGEPANLKSRIYTNSSNNEKSIWVDSRDGKGALIVYDVKSGEEKTLRTQSGLTNPVRWLNENTVVYRVKSDSETADYAISLDGGDPQKIADVTNTDGIDKWYYY